MCHSIYLSTDSPQDLGAEPFEHLQFSADLDPEPAHEELLPLLAYPRRWFLNRREYGGCSCHFRHCYESTFEPPQNWAPEEEDDVAATREAYRAFRKIVEDGYHLDVIDVFADDTPASQVQRLDVSFRAIDEEAFQFFSGYQFDFDK